MNNKLYKLMNWPKIEEIIYSESDDPHALLGLHAAGKQTLAQIYCPNAESVEICLADSDSIIKMEKADEDGYFAALIPMNRDSIKQYTYKIKQADGTETISKDAYAFEPQISEEDLEKFKHGIHYTVYEKLGAHPMTINGTAGVYFAVWAPNCLRVSTVGDFNHWDGRIHQMRRLGDSGIFEIFIPDVKIGDLYKFELKLKSGITYLKADPYGNAAQLRPDSASVIASLDDFTWDDAEYMKARTSLPANRPMSVYELYLGSFVEGKNLANYREIADVLIPYVKEMGYTHVELMPVMEHPLDNSWGYQVIGYYAPTARYGSPEDFMYFMNEMHKAGIGVILDWVPAHFPKDDHGLANFDGTCLYEHKDPRQGMHPHWGTLIYNYGRPEVSNYLIANALFWVEKYHADGIRIDAVASMLYLDYGRNDGEWIANMYGGNENLEAIELLKHLNSIMHKRNPGVMMIAEDSTAYPMITGDLNNGGLGFDYKWNMGFMNDYIEYIKNDPYFRSYEHGKLTFSMIYAYSEKFMLVYSHDEVVHGKATMIGKMPGSREQKFANLRLTYSYMMTHPGKKLLFMGQDLGEFDEWNEGRSVQWYLKEVPEHKGILELVKTMNHLYTSKRALYEMDDDPDGFEWINNISANDCYLTYARKTANPKDMLLVVANFSGVEKMITTGVPYPGKYKEIFNSDDNAFGGSGITNSKPIPSEEREWDDRPESISVSLAPTSISILEYTPFTKKELEKREEEKALKAAIAAQEAALKLQKEAEEKARLAKEAAEKMALEAKAAMDAAAKAEKETLKATKLVAEENERLHGSKRTTK